MSFGPEIEEILTDLGTEFTILRDSGNVTGENLLYKINRQVTKPFVREFFVEATFSYTTAIVPGDIIEFGERITRYLLISLSEEQFENQVFDNQSVLYKCNVSGELLRQSGETWDAQTYRSEIAWDTIKPEVFALFTEELYGNVIDEGEEVGQIENKALVLYLPSSIGIKPLDRYIPISGETRYKVESVQNFRFPSIDVAHLEEDTRED